MKSKVLSRAFEKEQRKAIAEATRNITAVSEQAIVRLRSLIAGWERSAQALQDFGLDSIAAASLADGCVWTFQGEHQGDSLPDLKTFLETVLHGPLKPEVPLWPKVSVGGVGSRPSCRFEIFVLVRPVDQEKP